MWAGQYDQLREASTDWPKFLEKIEAVWLEWGHFAASIKTLWLGPPAPRSGELTAANNVAQFVKF